MKHWRYLLFTLKVTGESMWPRLVPGKHYWASAFRKPLPGRVVIFKDAKSPTGLTVKLVKEFKKDHYYLDGTVSWSDKYKVKKDEILGTLF